jgi:hypothetical protein
MEDTSSEDFLDDIMQQREVDVDRPSMYTKNEKKFYVIQPDDNLTKLSFVFGIKMK